MGNVRRPISYTGSRRPRSSVFDRREYSLSRKRPRSSAVPQRPPRRIPRRYYSSSSTDDDDNFICDEDDGSHGHRDDDDDGEEDDDEQQSRSSEDERGGSSRQDVLSDGSDANDDDVAGEEQPATDEEDSDDDDRPLSYVSCARNRGSISAPSAQPLLRRRRTRRYYSEDDDVIDDDDGSHGRRDDDDREEQPQSGSGDDERGSSRDDESAGADDVMVAGGRVEEQLPAEEEGDSDDDSPISVVSRARTQGRTSSTSTAPAPAPAPPEPSPPSTTAPAPPESSPMAPAPTEPSPPSLSTTAPAPPPSPSLSDSSSAIRNVTVENPSAFDCSICYLPLKSPIFQWTVGHAVCSACHEKLGQATKCHVCRVAIPDGYSRCIAMEQAVDSIHVPCPHAAHGCTVKPAYHDRDAHAQTCVHKRHHCPGEGCGFASPVQATLLEHFATAHGWPCSAGNTGPYSFCARLRKGFNIVTACVGQGGATAEEQYTFVLNVEQPAPVCFAITAFCCIHPRNNVGAVRLDLSYYRYRWCSNPVMLGYSYVHSEELNVNGGPCSPFVVPSCSAASGNTQEEDYININIWVRHLPGNQA